MNLILRSNYYQIVYEEATLLHILRNSTHMENKVLSYIYLLKSHEKIGVHPSKLNRTIGNLWTTKNKSSGDKKSKEIITDILFLIKSKMHMKLCGACECILKLIFQKNCQAL